jgi:hypothetical protein
LWTLWPNRSFHPSSGDNNNIWVLFVKSQVDLGRCDLDIDPFSANRDTNLFCIDRYFDIVGFNDDFYGFSG